jgi:hypothetical protein
MNDDNVTPFSVKTPETLPPRDVVSQFVDHAAYHKVIAPGHTLIQGPRGSGKSMLFRYMSPACQCIARNKSVSELPFVAFVLQSKRANVQMPELDRISPTARRILIENLLVVMVASQACEALLEVCKLPTGNSESLDAWVKKLHEVVVNAVAEAGYELAQGPAESSPIARLKHAQVCLGVVEKAAQDYLADLAFDPQPKVFPKRLLNYQFFLLPLFKSMREISINTNQSFFVLIDDGDWFKDEQTRVINSWISFRTTDIISFKVTHQLEYKTYLTIGSRRIESPHDFSRVDLGSIYTHGTYRTWVKGIVEKRLGSFEIKKSAEEFFPYDQRQMIALDKIISEIDDATWRGPKTERIRDDRYRYARPELIRRLGGVSKQTSKFLYCGFDQLVDISNATIRFFLEAASAMYAEDLIGAKNMPLQSIKPQTQSDVVRAQADRLMRNNFDEAIKELVPDAGSNEDLTRCLKRVKNLVNVMGAAFYASLVCPVRAERRVLAFALQTEPDDEVTEVLRLAVGLSFFTESSLGRKEGYGRTKRYVLNRLIAPHFNLDPSGFSGYLWVTGDLLRTAIDKPTKALDMLRKRLPTIADPTQGLLQLESDVDLISYAEADDEKN